MTRVLCVGRVVKGKVLVEKVLERKEKFDE